MSWCSRTISQNMLWSMWSPIRPLRPSPRFCIRVTSQSLELWPGSQVIVVQTSWTALLANMCKLLGVNKLWTTPYHPQMNGLVERSCQTIMWMIGKLWQDEKVNWPAHLAEIVHAYNATQSTVMGYSPHYLMFGCRPRLPVNFYFPILRSVEGPRRGTSTKHVNEEVATVRDHLRTTFQEAQAQSTAEAQETKTVLQLENRHRRFETWQSHPSQGRHLSRKEEEQGQMGGQASQGGTSHHDRHPPYEVEDHHGNSHILHCNWFLLIASEASIPICVDVHQVWDGYTSPTSVKPTPRGSDRKTMPQEDNGLAITQHQARRTSLGWINGKLWLLLWMSAGTST